MHLAGASIFIWSTFFLMFFVLGEFNFRVPNEDFIIYSRIAYYNDMFGKENTQTFYNLFDKNIPNEIYHFTEIWGMAFFKFIDNQSLIKNYFFLLSPIFCFISFLGFKEIFPYSKTFVLLIISILLLFIVFPYDLIPILGISNLPLVGIGTTIFSLKNIFILPIFILILLELKKEKVDYIKISIVTFLYPVVMPVVLGGLIFNIILFEKEKIKNLIFPVFISTFFVIYSYLGSSNDIIVNLSNLLDPKIVLKVIYISVFIPFLVLILLMKNQLIIAIFSRKFSIFVFLSLAISIVLWILMYSNIDSNQMFRNTFHSIFILLIGIGIYQFWDSKNYKSLFLVIFIFILPFGISNYKNNFILEPNGQILKSLINITKGENILIIPGFKDVFRIYDFNERFYNPLNELYLSNENLNLINISSSFPENLKLNSVVSQGMLRIYRDNSPFFQDCGEWSYQDLNCLVDFSKSKKINFLFSKEDIENPKFIIQDLSVSNYKLYRF
ncbi:MAG: hypothetical protein PSV36_10385 [Algoriphagus sp.]|nr:hypothetical protein [Algoriphagus sp.]